MNILFVLEHFYPYIGGAEQLFWELAQSLVQKGHQVSVVTTRFQPDLKQDEEIDGISIRRVDCHNRFLFSFFSLPAVLRRSKGVDIIQTTSYNAALPAFIAGIWNRKPVVITFHEVWNRLWWRLPFTPVILKLGYFLWEKLLIRLPFQKFIAVSDATERSLVSAGVQPSRISRVYNGLDYGQFAAFPWRPPAQFTATYFGRLGPSKGLDLLLPAIEKFLKQHPEARFKLIIPTVPAGLYDKVRGHLEQMDSQGQLLILHDLDRLELFEEVSTSSCVIIPSLSEGFCFVAAEAAGLGVPIISSQRKALEEVVSGYYLPIDPLTPEHVVETLQRARQGEWLFKPLRKFSVADFISGYIKTYQSLLRPAEKA